MAEFVQALDPSKLVLAETALSVLISPFYSASYNLPIFLFGIYAQENTDAVLSLQVFSSLVGVSAISDIVWMIRNEQNWLVKLVSILILLLKAPTFFAFAGSLRARGAQFSGLGGIRGGDLSGPTVWSMPGGFTSSRDGYQTVDEREPEVSRPPAPSGPPPTNTPSAPGGYQTV